MYDITSTAVVSKDRADGAEISCELYYINANITHSPFIVTQTYYDNNSGEFILLIVPTATELSY